AQIEQLGKNVQRIEQQKETLQHQANQIQSQVHEDEQGELEQLQQQLCREISTLEAEIEQYVQRIEQAQQSYQANKNQQQTLKTEIQVLLSEQKNLSQLVAKQSPKQNQDTLRLMQALELTEQGKPHAQIIEKFLAKWLQAHIVETEQAFQEGIARQLKPSEQSSKFKGNLTCLNDWIASPQLSIFSNVAIAQDLSHALNEQKQLQYGQSILT
ncbi:chromosome segregation protein SMC, partial [Acinetobacter baumannii]